MLEVDRLGFCRFTHDVDSEVSEGNCRVGEPHQFVAFPQLLYILFSMPCSRCCR